MQKFRQGRAKPIALVALLCAMICAVVAAFAGIFGGFGATQFASAKVSSTSFKIAGTDGAFDAVIAANVLHLLPAPEQAVRELWRVTAPGGRLLLPTYLQGKVGAAYGAVIKIYHGVGFHYEHAFTPETYRTFLERLGLGRATVEIIPGRLPVGLAVLQKPEPSGGPF